MLIHHTSDKHCVSTDIAKQIPSFLLDGDSLGIVSEQHAEEIARDIVCPVDLEYESVTVSVCATLMPKTY
jgi:hypothetical protein